MVTPIVKVLVASASLLTLVACGSGQPPQAENGVASTPAASPQSSAAPVANGSVSPLAEGSIAAAKPTGQPCSLDSVDDNYAKQVHLDPTVSHVFRGWMLGPSRQPAGKFSIALIGAKDYALSSTTGVNRGDVGDYLKDPALATAGFAFQVSLKDVQAGTYQTRLLTDQAGTVYVCDTEKMVVIGHSRQQ